eukprot:4190024-Pyramimonas_sp.AAC.1
MAKAALGMLHRSRSMRLNAIIRCPTQEIFVTGAGSWETLKSKENQVAQLNQINRRSTARPH